MLGWRAGLTALGASVAFGAGEREGPTLPFEEQFGGDGRPPLPSTGVQDAFVRELNLGRIVRRDPGLRMDEFVAGAVEAFLAVEGAWQRLDPQRSRRYLCGPLWCSHRARMELYALHDRRNLLEGLVVRAAAVVAVEADDGAERITVRVTAHSGDCDVSGAGALLRGDHGKFDWQEDWVFQRNAAALTIVGGGVMAQRCPNCGAPLDVDETGVCRSCRAPVMDGTRDWVVVAVRRVEEERWRLRAVLGMGEERVSDVPGHEQLLQTVRALPQRAPCEPAPLHSPQAVALLLAIDPDFDPAELVQHAGASFTALRRSWATLDPSVVQPYMDQATAAAFAATLAAERAAGHGHLADDPLVEGVRIAAARDAQGLVNVDCEVVAELRDAVTAADGSISAGDAELHHRQCVLTFCRQRGARSPSGRVGMMRCPRCGAPLAATVLEPCPFCREAVAGGGGEWALVRVGEPVDVPLDAAPAVDVDANAPTKAAGSVDPFAAVRATDPAFNEHELFAGARETFYLVEQSIVQLDGGPCAARLSPGLLAEHTARLEQLRAERHHRMLTFIELAGVEAVSVRVEGPQATVVLRLGVRGQDYERDDVSGAVVDGAETMRRWDEDWTLQRSTPGADWLVTAIHPITGKESPRPE